MSGDRAKKKRFVILGAGAMGCLYGAKLKKAGQEVDFIDTNRTHMDAVNRKGLLVIWPEYEERLPIPAFYAEEYHTVADVVIVFTKTMYSQKALDSLKHAIGEDTILVSFQNGLGNDEILKGYVDEDRIVIGTTNFPADRTGDGAVAIHGMGTTRMRTLSGKDTGAFTELIHIFRGAGLNPEKEEDIMAVIWEKAAFNAAMNSVAAIASVPQGYFGETSEGKELCHSVVSEVCSVARRKGIPVKENQVHDTVDRLLVEHFFHCPSMLQDILKKNPTEIDGINGKVVREAERFGMEVPVTRTLFLLVKILEQTFDQRKYEL